LNDAIEQRVKTKTNLKPVPPAIQKVREWFEGGKLQDSRKEQRMATATNAKADNPFPIHTDTIVCRLDLFPELVRALRDGDLLAGRLFCAELFSIEGVTKSTHLASRDESSLKTIPPFV
jgi:hypothetical protein